MNILSRIKLPKSADISGFTHCNECIYKYQENSQEIVLGQVGLYPQILTLIHFTKSCMLNIQILTLYTTLKLSGDFKISFTEKLMGKQQRAYLFREFTYVSLRACKNFLKSSSE